MERPQNMVQLQIMGKDTIFCKGEETEENHYTQKINMLKKTELIEEMKTNASADNW